MKKVLLVLTAVIMSTPLLQAQGEGSKYGEDSVKCRENLYIYYELAKKRNFLEAYDGWDYVYNNCPRSSINNFIYGPYIVKAKMKEVPEAEKQKYKELLLKVYDKRLQYFPNPKKKGYVLTRKAVDLVRLFPDSAKQAYDLFRRALELDGLEQSAAFYNYMFVAAARMYNKDQLEEKGIFEAYNIAQEGIKTNTDALNRKVIALEGSPEDTTSKSLTSEEKEQLAKYERELERYKNVVGNVDKIITPIATCSRLGNIYNDSTFQVHKTDTVWLKRAAKMLQRKRPNDEGKMEDCSDLPIFFKISDALYKMQPSAPSARGMFILAYRNENYSKAVDYVKEAIELEIDPQDQADDYLRLAQTYLKIGNEAGAASAARNAARLKKNWGDPYLILAQSYAAASSRCGNDAFEKGAVFWAAINKLQYARSIDPSVAERANSLIATYREQTPDKGVSFQLGHSDGEEYTIGCFINETVTVEF
jgi:tetratricopeptide (TPR) repeat protein